MKQVQAPKQKEKKVVVATIRWKTFASPEREKPYCCPLPCHINNLQQASDGWDGCYDTILCDGNCNDGEIEAQMVRCNLRVLL